jgi:hypothetical protein
MSWARRLPRAPEAAVHGRTFHRQHASPTPRGPFLWISFPFSIDRPGSPDSDEGEVVRTFAALAQVFDIYCEFRILSEFVKRGLRDSHVVRKLLVSAAAEGFR